MKGFISLFCIICVISTAVDAKELTQKQKMKICGEYFRYIEKLVDNGQHKHARKYKSKMYKLNCPARHNSYYK